MVKLGHKTYKKNLETQRKYRSTPAGALIVFKGSAKQRGLVFSLTNEQFLSFWQKPCFYCGNRVEKIGLDRVNNALGYEITNVVSCCWTCNRMKTNYSQEVFLSICRQIARRHP